MDITQKICWAGPKNCNSKFSEKKPAANFLQLLRTSTCTLLNGERGPTVQKLLPVCRGSKPGLRAREKCVSLYFSCLSLPSNPLLIHIRTILSCVLCEKDREELSWRRKCIALRKLLLFWERSIIKKVHGRGKADHRFAKFARHSWATQQIQWVNFWLYTSGIRRFNLQIRGQFLLLTAMWHLIFLSSV